MLRQCLSNAACCIDLGNCLVKRKWDLNDVFLFVLLSPFVCVGVVASESLSFHFFQQPTQLATRNSQLGCIAAFIQMLLTLVYYYVHIEERKQSQYRNALSVHAESFVLKSISNEYSKALLEIPNVYIPRSN